MAPCVVHRRSTSIRRFGAIGDLLQFPYSATRTIEELRQSSQVGKQVGFKFVQLDERKEPWIIGLCLPRLLQGCYTIIRSTPELIGFFLSRKVVM